MEISEKQLHLQICTYLKMQYPKVIFTTDASGIKTSIGEAVRFKKIRSDNAMPDIVIYHQSIEKGIYFNTHWHALFLEVKKETPYKKDGQFKKNKHIEQQWFMLQRLNALHYKAEFVWTFDMAKEIIDNYLKI